MSTQIHQDWKKSCRNEFSVMSRKLSSATQKVWRIAFNTDLILNAHSANPDTCKEVSTIKGICNPFQTNKFELQNHPYSNAK